jgi:replicative DNA helicase
MSKLVTWDKVLAEEAKRLRRDAQRRASGETVLTHIPTSFEKLDSEYGGIRIGIVTELMAHTGDGKSAFMRQCAEGGAKAGAGCLWFVAEDPRDATAERQFAGTAGIGSSAIGRLDLDDKQLASIDRVAEAAAPWARRILPVFEEQDINTVLETIDQVGTIGGAPLQAVYIDYAQVLGSSKNLEDDIATLAKGLHQRSRKRGFATMIGSQVATEVVRRGRERFINNRDISQIRPSLGDTEWCRRLEKLSKAVWSLVRPGRWMREFGEETDDDYGELHVVKANFGPMGWVRLNWEAEFSRFTD